MKRAGKLSVYLLSLILVVFLTAVPVAAAEGESESGLSKDLVILFTSDVHCGVDQNFGLDGLYQVRKYYEDQGCYTLLVDDGDFIQGEPIGTMTKGEAPLELMNAAGYDIAIPGNHEFDYGMDQFLALTEKARFPYISCNFNKDGKLVFDPYVIKDFDGIKFAFVGITTPQTITSSTPAYFQDEAGNFVYDFCQDETGEKLYAKVQEAVDQVRKEGAQYVVAMAHLGNEDTASPWRYDQVISNTTGIDVLLDGHSHDTDQVTMKNKDGKDVIRTACGTKLACIGTVRFGMDGTISSQLLTWGLEGSAKDTFGYSNSVTEEVKKAQEKLDESLKTVVGHTDVNLTIVDPTAVDDAGEPIRIVRNAETNLGDLVADAYRAAGKADIGFANGGGVRANIAAGDITQGDILTVQPFGNMVCVAEMTGQQVLDALEWGARTVPSENGGFLQVSGLTYEIHTDVPDHCTQDENGLWTGHEGEYRVKNVTVGGKALELEKTYTVATHNYMLKQQGDGYNMFGDAKILQDEFMLDNQALINFIADDLGGTVGDAYEKPYGDGRIVAVEDGSQTEGNAETVTEAAS